MSDKKETAVIDIHNRVTGDELERLLKMQLKALFATPELAKTLPPLMVWGAPGLGKSSILQQVASEMKIGFIDVRLAQREPVDIRGLPVPGPDGVKWLVASEWPRDPDSRGIILFDEITAADRSLQVAAYEFILDRRLGELYKVPDGWYICAAGNRTEDRAVAATMSSALANRFLHVEMQEDVESWIGWARTHDIHPSVMGFIRYRPGCLFNQDNENLERGWPTPRSWERVSRMLAQFVTSCYGGSRRWLPPNRRHVSQGLYLQSSRKECLRAAVAIDTSGSTTNDLPRFFTELNSLLNTFGDYELTVIQCDAVVQHVDKFDAFNPFHNPEWETFGHGGTDFRPPFKYIAEHAEAEPSCLIYITDGCGPAPERAPNYPVLWLLTSDGEKPAKWGWSIKFKPEEAQHE